MRSLLLKLTVIGAAFGLASTVGAQGNPGTSPTTVPTTDGAAPASSGTVVEESLNEATMVPGSEDFNKRLLTVEERVNALKEQVFRSKATLQLLKEIVIQGSTSGARVALWHVDELGATYSLQSVSYYLDGQAIYTKTSVDGSLDENREFKLHEGAIPAGNHTISVSMVLRGNGFGVFSYVDRYTFNVQSSYAFAVEDGKACEVWIRTKERKGLGRSFVERPWVEYDLNCTRLGQGG